MLLRWRVLAVSERFWLATIASTISSSAYPRALKSSLLTVTDDCASSLHALLNGSSFTPCDTRVRDMCKQHEYAMRHAAEIQKKLVEDRAKTHNQKIADAISVTALFRIASSRPQIRP